MKKTGGEKDTTISHHQKSFRSMSAFQIAQHAAGGSPSREKRTSSRIILSATKVGGCYLHKRYAGSSLLDIL
jgi:hypothetical protein